MALQKNRIKVGITIGDPAGIGPAITLKAISRLRGIADFVVIGDKRVLDKVHSSCLAGRQSSKKYSLVDLNNVPHKGFRFGKVSAECGRAAVGYLDRALQLIRNKEIDCLVTCPVSKEAVNKSGIEFCGHTEYLAKKDNCRNYAMLLLNKRLKIILLTRHIPLKNVAFALNKNTISRTVTLAYGYLRKVFLIKNPRIAVCGLNPHASDNGLIGTEENKIIKPALARLRKKIKHIDGPLPADIAIQKAARGRYDCIIAMYHDQALIPLKLTGPASGVNLTLGLSFVRTSPLHGTAFDIAACPESADESSLIAAIKTALQCTQNLKRG